MMAKEAHTPGPWAAFPYYYERGDGEEHRLIGLGQFDTIADVRMGSDDVPGDLEANACLIAAAPCMKAALRALLDEISGTATIDSEAAGKAFEALAKEEGRTAA